MFPCMSELCKDTPRMYCKIPWEKRSGESVLWVLSAIPIVTLINWNCTLRWLLSKKWQEDCFFSKTQICDQNCCWNEEKNEPVCFSGRFEAANLQHSLVENTRFAIRPKFAGSHRHVSLQFQSCVKIITGHYVPFHEKRVQEKVFCECWVSYLLLLWLGEAVISDDFPARSGKQPFLSENSNAWPKQLLKLKKNELVCLSWRFQAATLQLSQGILLLPSGPISQVQKNHVSHQFQSYVNTLRTHCTILWEKRSGDSILWVELCLFLPWLAETVL